MLIYQAALEHVKERLQGKHAVVNFGGGDFVVGIGISEESLAEASKFYKGHIDSNWNNSDIIKMLNDFLSNPWFLNKDGYLTCLFQKNQWRFDYADPRFFDKLDKFIDEVIIPAVPLPISSPI